MNLNILGYLMRGISECTDRVRQEMTALEVAEYSLTILPGDSYQKMMCFLKVKVSDFVTFM